MIIQGLLVFHVTRRQAFESLILEAAWWLGLIDARFVPMTSRSKVTPSAHVNSYDVTGDAIVCGMVVVDDGL